MHLGVWQIVYLVLIVLGIGMDFSRTGEPKTGEHNVWVTIIASALCVSILYAGGFFSQQ